MATKPTPKKRANWRPKFLKALEETHLVTEAAKRAGIHRATAYECRSTDAEFRRQWEDVEERSTEVLEQIAVRRAATGSDVLLIFLLKARRPDVYRENHHVQHVGPDGGAVAVRVQLDAAQREVLADVLRRRPATRSD